MGLTTKVLLHTTRQKKDGSYPLVIRMNYNRKIIYIPLGYTFHEKDFDAKNQRIRPTSKVVNNVTRLNNYIASQVKHVFDTITKLEEGKKLSHMSMLDIKQAVMGKEKEASSVFEYFEQHIHDLERSGKFGNARAYRDSYHAWKKYRKDVDLTFDAVSYNVLKGFESFFLSRGVKPNTISVYLRTFRALLNKAIKEGLAKKEHYPFEQYHIPSNKTKKRAVSLEVINAIEDYKPSQGSGLWHSRNYFLFSFYARGMNFVDMAYLKRSDIRDDRIFYTRRKTGGEFTLKIHPKLQELIDRYWGNAHGNEYLFPIIQTSDDASRSFVEVKNGLRYFNKALKKIADHLDLNVSLTSYTARHSYATGLKMKGLSSEVIKESLGHDNVQTTETYLKSFENEVVDQADEVLFG